MQPEETASAVFCWGFYIHAAFVKELKEPGVLTLFDSQVKNLCRVSKTVDKIDDYLKKFF